MRSHLAVLALLAVSLIAGCSSKEPGTGPAAPTDGGAAPARSSFTLAAPPAQPANATAPAWSAHESKGEFTTFDKIVGDPESGLPGVADAKNTLEVPEGARRAFFNFTVTADLPGELTIWVHPEECFQATCRVEGTTEGGKLSLSQASPPAGRMVIEFFAQAGPQRGTYTVQVNSLV
jgi:hypothetical protein